MYTGRTLVQFTSRSLNSVSVSSFPCQSNDTVRKNVSARSSRTADQDLHRQRTLCRDLGSPASSSRWGIWSDCRRKQGASLISMQAPCLLYAWQGPSAACFKINTFYAYIWHVDAPTFKYTPAEEQKMYCSRSGSASRMGAASVASRPFMSYTTAQLTMSIQPDRSSALRGGQAALATPAAQYNAKGRNCLYGEGAAAV